MKEIVILSGKGGTGKTSLAASLAVLAGKEAVIADYDVDAANMHILLKPDHARGEDFSGGELAVIDPAICTSCGLCAEKCRFDAIHTGSDSYKVNLLDCEGCGYCEKICPEKAIVMVPRKTGELFISGIRTGSSMVHATMEAGAENSGKMVTAVKREAVAIAERSKVPLVISDGSPGLGCPVIASLAGANMAVLVTEPSVSALHDLRRLIKVIEVFRIKTLCVINKSDLNPAVAAEIGKFLDASGILHIGDIPFDEEIARAMADAVTLVETDRPGALAIREIWEKIRTYINN
ncbi:MAG: ATP-binding protein [Bacteroidales bacterium]|jgi:MinD superfamily P-loop ATPase|nr:ATP-binding protein [Bacteroidales bacterium]